MNLVRDVLDNQIVDRTQTKMGKVDGIVFEQRDGQPPRLTYIETGFPTLAGRLHPRLAKWVSTVQHHWGAKQSQSYRIEWSKVRDVGTEVNVDLDAKQTPAFAYEHWLQQHIISRIPGGK